VNTSGGMGFEDKMISNIEEIWQGGAFSVEDL